MLYRTLCLFLVGSLLLIASPLGNTATPARVGRAQSAGTLQMQQSQTVTPSGGAMYRLRGQYNSGQQAVKLNALTVRGPSFSVTTPNYAEEGRYEPDAEYYYSYAEMSRSDGMPLVQTTYEYEETANRNMLYITIAGVTLTFNLNTGEEGPITDEEQARLNAWIESEDGRLVQDASDAILEQGQGQVEGELLLNYYAVTMMVDTIPPSESASKSNAKGKNSSRVARARSVPKLGASISAKFVKTCYTPTYSLVGGGDSYVPAVAGLRQDCWGCCGRGCRCIRDRCGRVISGGPCMTHDNCTHSTNNPLERSCRPSLVAAIAYVWMAWNTCLR